MKRTGESIIMPANEIPVSVLKMITEVRKNDNFNSFSKPLIMGILNITPDSFSDGGKNFEPDQAFRAAERMIIEGADILDIGGESTRPGAKEVSEEEELMRVEPVITKIKSQYPQCKISVDTRKSTVARRVLELGVNFINDVSALTFDKTTREVLAKTNAQVCLMHGGLNPETMQKNTTYSDVLLDIYDYLKKRIDFAVAGGIKKDNILIDPGIGFGKTTVQNVLLIRKASLFHSLGCPILYGVSRKRFIGNLGQVPKPIDRFPGSMVAAIELVRQGVQVLRVHDVKQTKQALDVWDALV